MPWRRWSADSYSLDHSFSPALVDLSIEGELVARLLSVEAFRVVHADAGIVVTGGELLPDLVRVGLEPRYRPDRRGHECRGDDGRRRRLQRAQIDRTGSSKSCGCRHEDGHGQSF